MDDDRNIHMCIVANVARTMEYVSNTALASSFLLCCFLLLVCFGFGLVGPGESAWQRSWS